MKHLYFLLFFLTISVGFAAPVYDESTAGEIIKSAKLNGLNCEKIEASGCSYTECIGAVGNYPQPVLITIPEKSNSLRVHFHGHLLGLPETVPYEESLTGMVKAFGVQKSLCASSEVTVFPGSTGKNTTYKEFFKDKVSYTQFLKDVQMTLGNNIKESPLHLSAHSGGGKYVSEALNAEIKASKVSIFDGIYSSETKDSLKEWYKNGNGRLTIGTIKGMSPDNYTAELRAELGVKITSTKNSISGTMYDVHQAENFVQYSRYAGEVGSTKAHFDVLSQIWPIENQAR